MPIAATMFTWPKITWATAGSTASKPRRPAARWHAAAPSDRPRPMAAIFRMPLPSRVLSKSVCGLMRLTRITPSAASASSET